MLCAIKPITFNVPAALDLEAMFEERDRDYVAYFCDLLHRKLLSWQIDRRECTRLMRKLITRFIPRQRFTRIRTRLLAHGVIGVDRSYRAGEYSMGYRLEPKYWESKPVECRNPSLVRKIREYQEEQERRLKPVHRWLRSNLNKISFAYDMAQAIIANMVPDAGSPLTTLEYRTLIREMGKRFRETSRALTVDKYGRVHTNITNLPKELRVCLSFRGQHLAGVDLACSQPLICGIVAQRYTTSTDGRKRMIARDFDERRSPYVGKEIKEMQRRHSAREGIQEGSEIGVELPSIMWCTDAKHAVNNGSCSCRQVPGDVCPSDLERYLRLCAAGELYDHLLADGEDRGEFKKRLFTDVFFGKIGYRTPLKTRFEREFPTVAAMLWSLKANDYAHSAHLMQSYESTIFIDIICRRLMQERPDLPVLTIHDSILTVPHEIEYVSQVAREEFAKLGIQPTLRVEHYG